MKKEVEFKIFLTITILTILIGCSAKEFETTEDHIEFILNRNVDFREYSTNHQNYTLSITELTPEKILEKQENSTMKTLYEDLPEKTLYEAYADDKGNGVIVIIDLEEEKVLKIVGLLLTNFGG